MTAGGTGYAERAASDDGLYWAVQGYWCTGLRGARTAGLRVIGVLVAAVTVVFEGWGAGCCWFAGLRGVVQDCWLVAVLTAVAAELRWSGRRGWAGLGWVVRWLRLRQERCTEAAAGGLHKGGGWWVRVWAAVKAVWWLGLDCSDTK
ncbi:hypothetical protein Acr_02g0008290 [Actinidia rufa]|uniref:Uncharacterized protein n=1 Tax=Actinidia rufa TaxID=165716 RepID=A0A7J0E9J9_9ERIC|nr:hypothetical protein Acr_02g0008290 [Actinidia rufa]